MVRNMYLPITYPSAIWSPAPDSLVILWLMLPGKIRRRLKIPGAQKSTKVIWTAQAFIFLRH